MLRRGTRAGMRSTVSLTVSGEVGEGDDEVGVRKRSRPGLTIY